MSIKDIGFKFSCVFFGLLISTPGLALDISKVPLFAGGGAKPNVLFMIDDSGSMRDAVNPTQAAAATPELSGMAHSQFMIDPQSANDRFDDLLLSLDDEDEGYSYFALCPGVNVLAFDPNKNYAPWYGLADSSFPNVQKIPNQSSFGSINLASARYIEWEDNDSDGEYDFGECGGISAGTKTVREIVRYDWWGRPVYGDVEKKYVRFDTSKLKNVSNLTAEQKQNFANWYTYHRSREYAVKAGLSPVLAELQVRAGMSTIHIHNQAGINWGLNIADVDDITNPAMAANKTALINELYEIISVTPTNFGGTPLRRTLENAGFYFNLGDPGRKASPETNFLPNVSTSPILSEAEGGACQANHMILVTDGYQFEFSGQGPRFTNWGNVDSTVTSGGGLYADTLSNTLADIAMYFYDRDASPTLPGHQNVHTHALSFGVYGNIDGFPTSDVEKQWPTDIDRMIGDQAGEVVYPDSLDDVVHAAFNGRGRFMTATDAETLQSEMDSLMEYISRTRKGTATAISFDYEGINTSTQMFRTLYVMEDWSGKLNSYAFTASTGTVGAEQWEASDRLALKDENNQRKIVTFNGVKGAPFRVPADYSAPSLVAGELNLLQVADLLASKPNGIDNAEYIQDMVEYLRQDGDGFTTSPQFRVRGRLGDIVHSSPVYVGAPSAYYSDSFEAEPYSDFVTANSARTPMVYVGANDGMLHGFNANTGDEVFAYIPQHVFSSASQAGMHWLADPNYTHLPYVDETPVTGDVFIGGAWRTYLVGGLGRGGKSIFVLDITDPASIADEATMASDVVVKEFSDAYLGYTFGAPKITKLEDGEWVAIFGNGYNNDTDGKAYLYVLYLDGAGPGGVGHVKIGPLGGADVGSVVSGSTCEDAGSDCNGLSEPTLVDLNGNGKLDRVYAGDLHGNVWAFDFTKDTNGDLVNADNTNSVVPVIAHQNNFDQPIPLFTACRGAKPVAGYCRSADRQPITTKANVIAHPTQKSAATEPNLLVYVGTGRYIAEVDVTNTDTQTFYGIWDSGDGGLRPGKLTTQAFVADANGNRTMTTVNPVSYVTQANDPNRIGNYGWKMNLATGERVIENATVVNEIIVFPTRITSNDPCDRRGTGFIMGIDLTTGGKPPYQVFPGEQADIGFEKVAGGELTRWLGGPPGFIPTDPFDDTIPEKFDVRSEAKRAPKRSSWTIIK